MANDSNCNFDTTLSLDKAILVGRGRVNALGSQELVLRYNGIASVVREDCIEYLEANRKTLDDPKFSFKTYEGTWNCISITYNEKQSVIEQTFKIDSQIGDLGEIPSDPIVIPDDYNAQLGDVSRISDGVTIEKAYYWRIVDPTIIELPATAIDGQIWTKTANDNGDGTYDVIVTREKLVNQTAESFVDADAYGETTVVNTNNEPQSFVSQGGLIADAILGEIKRIQNTPLENGKYRTEITTRSVLDDLGNIISQRIPPTEGTFVSWNSDWSVATSKLIKGRNRPYNGTDSFETDLLLISAWASQGVVSVNIDQNEYGLYDYTMRLST